MKFIPADPRIRYIFAGGFASLVNLLVRFPLDWFMPYAAAVTIATAIGMVVGFFTYKHFVFEPTDRSIWLQIRDFIGVNFAAGIATVVIAVAIRELPNWPDGWMDLVEPGAHATGIALAAIINYFGHRYITFASAKEAPNNAD